MAPMSGSKTNLNKRSKELLLLLLVGMTIFFLQKRSSQIYSYQTKDFDTEVILQNMDAANPFNFRAFFDVAHPGLLSIWVWVGNRTQALSGLSPFSIWVSMLIVTIVLSTLLILITTYRLSNSIWMALIGGLAYLTSPIVSDLSNRAEENFLYHPLLIYLLYLLCQKNMSQAKREIRIILCILVLGAQHLQPIMILAIGLCIGIILQLLKKPSLELLKSSLLKYLKYLLPIAIYYSFLRLVVGQPVTNYASVYYSFFNNDSIGQYLKSFLMFEQGYLVTGIFQFLYTENGSETGIQVTTNHYNDFGSKESICD
jgi:hypothetical protein